MREYMESTCVKARSKKRKCGRWSGGGRGRGL